MNAKGFTVIELIIVIVIVGILAVMVIPRIIDTGTINPQESAEMVAADIRKTQELAMADIISHTITFNSGTNTYTIDQGTANPQTLSLPSNVRIMTSATITFSPSGVPNAAVSIDIGGIQTVSVVQNTGRVTIP